MDAATTSTPASPTSPADAVLGDLATLGDAARLRVLVLLERAELTVGDLCGVLQMPQSTVSRHLKNLAEQGWVVHRRQATTRRYRLVLDELHPGQRDLWRVTRDRAAEWATLRQDALRLKELLARQAETPAAFFAGMADRWTQARDTLYGHGVNAHLLAAAIHPDDHVVDFGCGTADLARSLAPYAGSVIGLDSSREMLDAARRGRPPSKLTLRQCDLADTGLPDASADLALCSLSLSYTADPAAVLAEAYRVLRPDGRIVVLDLLAHDRDDFRREMNQARNGFDAADFKRTLKRAGFKRIHLQELPPTPETTAPALFLTRATCSG